MNIYQLQGMFDDVKNNNFKYFGVLIKMPNGMVEAIINKAENLDFKFNYYLSNYDSELRMNKCPEISIIGAFCGNDFDTLERILEGELI